MVKLVALRQACPNDQTCVWMNAGLLAYKLCDRNFDCEHCPLDAALRGGGGVLRNGEQPHPPATFPDDRLYTSGHTWVGGPNGASAPMRFGLDAFAALLIGPARRVRWRPASRPLRRGEAICVVDLEDGNLALAMPVSGTVVRWNEAVRERPESIAADPYGAGWIVELQVRNPGELDGLLHGAEIRHQTRLDVRRFRRHVGFELLVAGADSDASPDAQGEAVTDLRRMLGGITFLSLVRDLIH